MIELSFVRIWQEFINRRCDSTGVSKLRASVCVLSTVCSLAFVFIGSTAEAGTLAEGQHSNQEVIVDGGNAGIIGAQTTPSLEQPHSDSLLNLDSPVLSIAANGEPIPQEDASPSTNDGDSSAEASMGFDEFVKLIQDHWHHILILFFGPLIIGTLVGFVLTR